MWGIWGLLFDLLVPHQTFRGLLIIICSFFMILLMLGVTGELRWGLLGAAMICLAFGGRPRDRQPKKTEKEAEDGAGENPAGEASEEPDASRRPAPKWLFIPTRVWGLLFLCGAVAASVFQPLEHIRDYDPRYGQLSRAERGQLSSNLGEDWDLPYDLRRAIESAYRRRESEDRLTDVEAFMNARGVLVIIKLDLSFTEEESEHFLTSMLERTEEEVRKRPALAEKPLYIGIKGESVYRAARVPPNETEIDNVVASDQLYPFFGDRPEPEMEPETKQAGP